ncbi:MAG: sugar phosphate isomerase/epimerase [Anaerolineae bacterium]
MLGLQLYSVREALAADFEGTLRKVAAIGYRGVELAGIYGESPDKTTALLAELNLTITSAHIGLPLDSAAVDWLTALKVTTWVCAWLPPERFTTLEGIRGVCDELNTVNASLQSQGIRLGYHNHHFEFLPLSDGTLPLYRMLEWLDPRIICEVDVYWVQSAGVSVVEVLEKLGTRAALLHLKDGPARLDQTQAPMVAAGEGNIDFKPILAASKAEHHIVELDRCATDMLEAVEKSYRYLSAL